MEKLLDVISFKYSDPEISEIINTLPGKTSGYTFHFNQNEDAFLKSGTSFTVPSFAVHHNVNEVKPSDEYLIKMRELVGSLSEIFPDPFRGTRYFFDPAEVLRPCFIQLFRIEESHYLYLMRPDLNIRPADSKVIQQATNDLTAEFQTRKLYFESMIIPIHKPSMNANGGEIPILRLFGSTWVGETGAGYHINGQWIDRELTRMLSALYLPEGIRTYPYYPLKCDFNTVTIAPAKLSVEGRKSFLGYLHKALAVIEKYIPEIEESMRTEKFSKDLAAYKNLRSKIPAQWTKIWSSLKISPYLNENDMKEYKLEFEFSS